MTSENNVVKLFYVVMVSGNIYMAYSKCYRHFVLVAVVAMCSCFAFAQDVTEQPGIEVENAKMVGLGWQALQDTYLTPEHYHGMEIRYISETLRQRETNAWSRSILNEGWISRTDSRSGNGGMISGAYDFRYGVLHTWKLLGNRLVLRAGAQGSATLGFIYNTRGGNNVAQARANVNVGPMALAQWKIGAMTVNYEVAIPLVGVCFSPNYGQSYYEIFDRGDYDHNIVPTTMVSTPSLRHMLSCDVRWLNRTWRIGYLGDYNQLSVNHLKQHIYTHSLVIGLVETFNVGRRLR